MNEYRWLKIIALIIALAVTFVLGYQLSAQSDKQAATPDGEAAENGPPPAAMGPPPARVRVGEVRHEPVQQRRLVTGRIDAVRHAAVAAEEAGLIKQPPPDRGTTVESGEVLARLDSSLVEADKAALTAELEEANARLEERKAELALAKNRLERLQRLLPTNAVSAIEVDEASRDVAVTKASLSSGEAAINRVQAQIDRVDLRLARMVIYAPFAGQIIEKHTESGEWVTTGGVIADLISIEQVDAIIDVPETIIATLPRDEEISVRITATGETVTGRIHRVVPRADARSRTVPVVIRLNNPEMKINPGMTVDAEVPTGIRETAVTIPRDALTITPSGTLVYVNRGEVAVPVSVHVRYGYRDRFVVAADLNAGEQVITEGNVRVNPGQPLLVIAD